MHPGFVLPDHAHRTPLLLLRGPFFEVDPVVLHLNGPRKWKPFKVDLGMHGAS